MENTKYCPLCGTEFLALTSDAVPSCEACGAQNYFFWGISLGYLYPEEYEQFKKFSKWMMGVISAILLIGFGIFLFKILPVFPH